MSDEQVAQVIPPLQLEKEFEDMGANRHVQEGNGLVGDHELRPEHQRPRDENALHLSPAHLRGELREELLGGPQSDLVENMKDDPRNRRRIRT